MAAEITTQGGDLHISIATKIQPISLKKPLKGIKNNLKTKQFTLAFFVRAFARSAGNV